MSDSTRPARAGNVHYVEIEPVTEIKLNEWRWGVVPELEPEAAVRLGGFGAWPCEEIGFALGRNLCDPVERWYAVLSLGPPAMPEPELRLPEGWEIDKDEEQRSGWMMQIFKPRDYAHCRARLFVFHDTRRECIEEINRILGGGK